MKIDSLFKNNLKKFIEDFYGNTFYTNFEINNFEQLFNYKMLNELLNNHRLNFPRIKLVKDGKEAEQFKYIDYVSSSDKRENNIPRLKNNEIINLLNQGYVLVIDAVNEAFDNLRVLQLEFERTFNCRVQINMYFSWKNSKGFNKHWDSHDVFVFQCLGEKEWTIYDKTNDFNIPNLYNPNLNENSKSTSISLKSGQLLYIPRGVWHNTKTNDNLSIHLTLGIHKKRNYHFFEWLGEKMLKESIDLRKDLNENSIEVLEKVDLNNLIKEKEIKDFVEITNQKTFNLPIFSIPTNLNGDFKKNSIIINLLRRKPKIELTENSVEFVYNRLKYNFKKDYYDALLLIFNHSETKIKDLNTKNISELENFLLTLSNLSLIKIQ